MDEIAGARPTATLRSRIRSQHLRGNIGSSTFRQSLAALLWRQQGWNTRWSGSRTQLTREHNLALSEWQRNQLRVAWVEVASLVTPRERAVTGS
jgi:hypothetical protein